MATRRQAPDKGTTIKDVATRAGVSLSSVSRVLNGHPAVSEELRQRVFAVVAELDYKPNLTAANLRRGSTMTVGVLMRDIANPIWVQVLRAAESELRKRGYSMLLANSSGEGDRDAAHIRMLEQRRVDGMILSLSSETNRETLAALRGINSPIVFIDRVVPELAASSVLSDHYSGMIAATRHLADLGHTRVALINGPNDALAERERLRGFKAGLRAASLRFDMKLVRTGDYGEVFGANATESLLAIDDPPTAIIAGGVMLTYGALRTIRERGLSMPADITLLGCDSWRAPELFEPALTRVDRDGAEIGRHLATILLDCMGGAPPRSVLLPTELIVSPTMTPA